MIDSIKISYHSDGVITTMEIADDYTELLPYVLADMFCKLIDDSNANPQILINALKDSYEYEND